MKKSIKEFRYSIVCRYGHYSDIIYVCATNEADAVLKAKEYVAHRIYFDSIDPVNVVIVDVEVGSTVWNKE